MLISRPVKSRNRHDCPAAARQRLSRACARPVALVAGDDALRSSVALLLTVAGITVSTHRSIRAYLSAGQAPYGCLIIDYRSGDPSMRGPFLDLLQRGEPIPIVAMTTAPEKLAADTAAYPNLRVVGKPFESDAFIDTIRALQDSQSGCGEPEAVPRETLR